MSSPRDMPMLSSSPVSVRGSPVMRRRGDSTSQTDLVDPSARSRQPPYLHPFDHNDPDSLERQRTMDVDMALQLSRARRETIVSPSSPYEPALHAESDHAFNLLMESEQHDFGVPRDDVIHTVRRDIVNGIHDESHRPTTPVDLEFQPLPTTHNHALIDTFDGRYPPVHHEDASASMSGLPSYQANMSCSIFDFTALETFATQEKASLGITPSNPPPFRKRHSSNVQADDTGQSSLPTVDAQTLGESSNGDPPPPPRLGARHRKLSQSSPIPRIHRRAMRGKAALFESRNTEPAPGFPACLMGDGQLSTVPSVENLSTVGQPYISATLGTVPGMMSPFDDRPYRFSFYSNALSATIHARSLCELPAEGELFEDLFTGIPNLTRQGGAMSALFTFFSSRPSFNCFGAPGGTGGANRQNEKHGGEDPGRRNGNAGDYEANTWWLDILCPTDEEMKVLSKVVAPFCRWGNMLRPIMICSV